MLKEDQCHPLDWSASSWTAASLWSGQGQPEVLQQLGNLSLETIPAGERSTVSHFFGLNVDLCYTAESLLTEKK